MSIAATQIIQLFHFRRILVEAAERGIDMAPLKGAHLATSVYPADRPRRMGDVDFLVRPADWRRTLELMVELGFRPRRPPAEEWWMHEAGFTLEVAPGLSLLVEAHRALIEPRRFLLDHEALWRRSTPSTLDGAPCRRLAPEDHLVFACLHAALHRLAMLPRALDDVEMLLRHGELSPEAIVARAREWKATRATWLMIRLIQRSHPDLDVRAITAQLTPPLPVRLALQTLVPGGERTRLAGQNHRLQAALLWPWLFDGPAIVARVVTHHPLLTRVFERPQWRDLT